ncbi:MAG: glycine zipper family protein [Candidatus Omnitrophota bacterium]
MKLIENSFDTVSRLLTIESIKDLLGAEGGLEVIQAAFNSLCVMAKSIMVNFSNFVEAGYQFADRAMKMLENSFTTMNAVLTVDNVSLLFSEGIDESAIVDFIKTVFSGRSDAVRSLIEGFDKITAADAKFGVDSFTKRAMDMLESVVLSQNDFLTADNVANILNVSETGKPAEIILAALQERGDVNTALVENLDKFGDKKDEILKLITCSLSAMSELGGADNIAKITAKKGGQDVILANMVNMARVVSSLVTAMENDNTIDAGKMLENANCLDAALNMIRMAQNFDQTKKAMAVASASVILEALVDSSADKAKTIAVINEYKSLLRSYTVEVCPEMTQAVIDALFQKTAGDETDIKNLKEKLTKINEILKPLLKTSGELNKLIGKDNYTIALNYHLNEENLLSVTITITLKIDAKALVKNFNAICELLNITEDDRDALMASLPSLSFLRKQESIIDIDLIPFTSTDGINYKYSAAPTTPASLQSPTPVSLRGHEAAEAISSLDPYQNRADSITGAGFYSLEEYIGWVLGNSKYVPDPEGWDRWMFKTTGPIEDDCEGFAFRNYITLQQLGYEPVILVVRTAQEDHAICAFKKDGKYSWFDNAVFENSEAVSLEDFATYISNKCGCYYIGQLSWDKSQDMLSHDYENKTSFYLENILWEQGGPGVASILPDGSMVFSRENPFSLYAPPISLASQSFWSPTMPYWSPVIVTDFQGAEYVGQQDSPQTVDYGISIDSSLAPQPLTTPTLVMAPATRPEAAEAISRFSVQGNAKLEAWFTDSVRKQLGINPQDIVYIKPVYGAEERMFDVFIDGTEETLVGKLAFFRDSTRPYVICEVNKNGALIWPFSAKSGYRPANEIIKYWRDNGYENVSMNNNTGEVTALLTADSNNAITVRLKGGKQKFELTGTVELSLGLFGEKLKDDLSLTSRGTDEWIKIQKGGIIEFKKGALNIANAKAEVHLSSGTYIINNVGGSASPGAGADSAGKTMVFKIDEDFMTGDITIQNNSLFDAENQIVIVTDEFKASGKSQKIGGTKLNAKSLGDSSTGIILDGKMTVIKDKVLNNALLDAIRMGQDGEVEIWARAAPVFIKLSKGEKAGDKFTDILSKNGMLPSLFGSLGPNPTFMEVVRKFAEKENRNDIFAVLASENTLKAETDPVKLLPALEYCAKIMRFDALVSALMSNDEENTASRMLIAMNLITKSNCGDMKSAIGDIIKSRGTTGIDTLTGLASLIQSAKEKEDTTVLDNMFKSIGEESEGLNNFTKYFNKTLGIKCGNLDIGVLLASLGMQARANSSASTNAVFDEDGSLNKAALNSLQKRLSGVSLDKVQGVMDTIKDKVAGAEMTILTTAMQMAASGYVSVSGMFKGEKGNFTFKFDGEKLLSEPVSISNIDVGYVKNTEELEQKRTDISAKFGLAPSQVYLIATLYGIKGQFGLSNKLLTLNIEDKNDWATKEDVDNLINFFSNRTGKMVGNISVLTSIGGHKASYSVNTETNKFYGTFFIGAVTEEHEVDEARENIQKDTGLLPADITLNGSFKGYGAVFGYNVEGKKTGVCTTNLFSDSLDAKSMLESLRSETNYDAGNVFVRGLLEGKEITASLRNVTIMYSATNAEAGLLSNDTVSKTREPGESFEQMMEKAFLEAVSRETDFKNFKPATETATSRESWDKISASWIGEDPASALPFFGANRELFLSPDWNASQIKGNILIHSEVFDTKGGYVWQGNISSNNITENCVIQEGGVTLMSQYSESRLPGAGGKAMVERLHQLSTDVKAKAAGVNLLDKTESGRFLADVKTNLDINTALSISAYDKQGNYLWTKGLTSDNSNTNVSAMVSVGTCNLNYRLSINDLAEGAELTPKQAIDMLSLKADNFEGFLRSKTALPGFTDLEPEEIKNLILAEWMKDNDNSHIELILNVYSREGKYKGSYTITTASLLDTRPVNDKFENERMSQVAVPRGKDEAKLSYYVMLEAAGRLQANFEKGIINFANEQDRTNLLGSLADTGLEYNATIQLSAYNRANGDYVWSGSVSHNAITQNFTVRNENNGALLTGSITSTRRTSDENGCEMAERVSLSASNFETLAKRAKFLNENDRNIFLTSVKSSLDMQTSIRINAQDAYGRNLWTIGLAATSATINNSVMDSIGRCRVNYEIIIRNMEDSAALTNEQVISMLFMKSAEFEASLKGKTKVADFLNFENADNRNRHLADWMAANANFGMELGISVDTVSGEHKWTGSISPSFVTGTRMFKDEFGNVINTPVTIPRGSDNSAVSIYMMLDALDTIQAKFERDVKAKRVNFADDTERKDFLSSWADACLGYNTFMRIEVYGAKGDSLMSGSLTSNTMTEDVAVREHDTHSLIAASITVNRLADEAGGDMAKRLEWVTNVFKESAAKAKLTSAQTIEDFLTAQNARLILGESIDISVYDAAGKVLDRGVSQRTAVSKRDSSMNLDKNCIVNIEVVKTHLGAFTITMDSEMISAASHEVASFKTAVAKASFANKEQFMDFLSDYAKNLEQGTEIRTNVYTLSGEHIYTGSISPNLVTEPSMFRNTNGDIAQVEARVEWGEGLAALDFKTMLEEASSQLSSFGKDIKKTTTLSNETEIHALLANYIGDDARPFVLPALFVLPAQAGIHTPGRLDNNVSLQVTLYDAKGNDLFSGAISANSATEQFSVRIGNTGIVATGALNIVRLPGETGLQMIERMSLKAEGFRQRVENVNLLDENARNIFLAKEYSLLGANAELDINAYGAKGNHLWTVSLAGKTVSKNTKVMDSLKFCEVNYQIVVRKGEDGAALSDLKMIEKVFLNSASFESAVKKTADFSTIITRNYFLADWAKQNLDAYTELRGSAFMLSGEHRWTGSISTSRVTEIATIKDASANVMRVNASVQRGVGSVQLGYLKMLVSAAFNLEEFRKDVNIGKDFSNKQEWHNLLADWVGDDIFSASLSQYGWLGPSFSTSRLSSNITLEVNMRDCNGNDLWQGTIASHGLSQNFSLRDKKTGFTLTGQINVSRLPGETGDLLVSRLSSLESVIPATSSVIPASSSVIPAEAGIHALAACITNLGPNASIDISAYNDKGKHLWDVSLSKENISLVKSVMDKQKQTITTYEITVPSGHGDAILTPIQMVNEVFTKSTAFGREISAVSNFGTRKESDDILADWMNTRLAFGTEIDISVSGIDNSFKWNRRVSANAVTERRTTVNLNNGNIVRFQTTAVRDTDGLTSKEMLEQTFRQAQQFMAVISSVLSANAEDYNKNLYTLLASLIGDDSFVTDGIKPKIASNVTIQANIETKTGGYVWSGSMSAGHLTENYFVRDQGTGITAQGYIAVSRMQGETGINLADRLAKTTDKLTNEINPQKLSVTHNLITFMNEKSSAFGKYTDFAIVLTDFTGRTIEDVTINSQFMTLKIIAQDMNGNFAFSTARVDLKSGYRRTIDMNGMAGALFDMSEVFKNIAKLSDLSTIGNCADFMSQFESLFDYSDNVFSVQTEFNLANGDKGLFRVGTNTRLTRFVAQISKDGTLVQGWISCNMDGQMSVMPNSELFKSMVQEAEFSNPEEWMNFMKQFEYNEYNPEAFFTIQASFNKGPVTEHFSVNRPGEVETRVSWENEKGIRASGWVSVTDAASLRASLEIFKATFMESEINDAAFLEGFLFTEGGYLTGGKLNFMFEDYGGSFLMNAHIDGKKIGNTSNVTTIAAYDKYNELIGREVTISRLHNGDFPLLSSVIPAKAGIQPQPDTDGYYHGTTKHDRNGKLTHMQGVIACPAENGTFMGALVVTQWTEADKKGTFIRSDGFELDKKFIQRLDVHERQIDFTLIEDKDKTNAGFTTFKLELDKEAGGFIGLNGAIVTSQYEPRNISLLAMVKDAGAVANSGLYALENGTMVFSGRVEGSLRQDKRPDILTEGVSGSGSGGMPLITKERDFAIKAQTGDVYLIDGHIEYKNSQSLAFAPGDDSGANVIRCECDAEINGLLFKKGAKVGIDKDGALRASNVEAETAYLLRKGSSLRRFGDLQFAFGQGEDRIKFKYMPSMKSEGHKEFRAVDGTEARYLFTTTTNEGMTVVASSNWTKMKNGQLKNTTLNYVWLERDMDDITIGEGRNYANRLKLSYDKGKYVINGVIQAADIAVREPATIKHDPKAAAMAGASGEKPKEAKTNLNITGISENGKVFRLQGTWEIIDSDFRVCRPGAQLNNLTDTVITFYRTPVAADFSLRFNENGEPYPWNPKQKAKVTAGSLMYEDIKTEKGTIAKVVSGAALGGVAGSMFVPFYGTILGMIIGACTVGLDLWFNTEAKMPQWLATPGQKFRSVILSEAKNLSSSSKESVPTVSLRGGAEVADEAIPATSKHTSTVENLIQGIGNWYSTISGRLYGNTAIGATSGAVLGSIFIPLPGVGTAIGALAGGIIGLTVGILDVSGIGGFALRGIGKGLSAVWNKAEVWKWAKYYFGESAIGRLQFAVEALSVSEIVRNWDTIKSRASKMFTKFTQSSAGIFFSDMAEDVGVFAGKTWNGFKGFIKNSWIGDFAADVSNKISTLHEATRLYPGIEVPVYGNYTDKDGNQVWQIVETIRIDPATGRETGAAQEAKYWAESRSQGVGISGVKMPVYFAANFAESIMDMASTGRNEKFFANVKKAFVDDLIGHGIVGSFAGTGRVMINNDTGDWIKGKLYAKGITDQGALATIGTWTSMGTTAGTLIGLPCGGFPGLVIGGLAGFGTGLIIAAETLLFYNRQNKNLEYYIYEFSSTHKLQDAMAKGDDKFLFELSNVAAVVISVTSFGLSNLGGAFRVHGSSVLKTRLGSDGFLYKYTYEDVIGLATALTYAGFAGFSSSSSFSQAAVKKGLALGIGIYTTGAISQTIFTNKRFEETFTTSEAMLWGLRGAAVGMVMGGIIPGGLAQLKTSAGLARFMGTGAIWASANAGVYAAQAAFTGAKFDDKAFAAKIILGFGEGLAFHAIFSTMFHAVGSPFGNLIKSAIGKGIGWTSRIVIVAASTATFYTVGYIKANGKMTTRETINSLARGAIWGVAIAYALSPTGIEHLTGSAYNAAAKEKASLLLVEKYNVTNMLDVMFKYNAVAQASIVGAKRWVFISPMFTVFGALLDGTISAVMGQGFHFQLKQRGADGNVNLKQPINWTTGWGIIATSALSGVTKGLWMGPLVSIFAHPAKDASGNLLTLDAVSERVAAQVLVPNAASTAGLSVIQEKFFQIVHGAAFIWQEMEMVITVTGINRTLEAFAKHENIAKTGFSRWEVGLLSWVFLFIKPASWSISYHINNSLQNWAKDNVIENTINKLVSVTETKFVKNEIDKIQNNDTIAEVVKTEKIGLVKALAIRTLAQALKIDNKIVDMALDRAGISAYGKTFSMMFADSSGPTAEFKDPVIVMAEKQRTPFNNVLDVESKQIHDIAQAVFKEFLAKIGNQPEGFLQDMKNVAEKALNKLILEFNEDSSIGNRINDLKTVIVALNQGISGHGEPLAQQAETARTIANNGRDDITITHNNRLIEICVEVMLQINNDHHKSTGTEYFYPSKLQTEALVSAVHQQLINIGSAKGDAGNAAILLECSEGKTWVDITQFEVLDKYLIEAGKIDSKTTNTIKYLLLLPGPELVTQFVDPKDNQAYNTVENYFKGRGLDIFSTLLEQNLTANKSGLYVMETSEALKLFHKNPALFNKFIYVGFDEIEQTLQMPALVIANHEDIQALYNSADKAMMSYVNAIYNLFRTFVESQKDLKQDGSTIDRDLPSLRLQYFKGPLENLISEFLTKNENESFMKILGNSAAQELLYAFAGPRGIGVYLGQFDGASGNPEIKFETDKNSAKIFKNYGLSDTAGHNLESMKFKDPISAMAVLLHAAIIDGAKVTESDIYGNFSVSSQKGVSISDVLTYLNTHNYWHSFGVTNIITGLGATAEGCREMLKQLNFRVYDLGASDKIKMQDIVLVQGEGAVKKVVENAKDSFMTDKINGSAFNDAHKGNIHIFPTSAESYAHEVGNWLNEMCHDQKGEPNTGYKGLHTYSDIEGFKSFLKSVANEVQSYGILVFTNPNDLSDALNIAIKENMLNAWGRIMHVVGPLVTGSNIAKCVDDLVNPAFVKDTEFTRFQVTAVGNLTSSGAIQQACRWSTSVEHPSQTGLMVTRRLPAKITTVCDTEKLLCTFDERGELHSKMNGKKVVSGKLGDGDVIDKAWEYMERHNDMIDRQRSQETVRIVWESASDFNFGMTPDNVFMADPSLNFVKSSESKNEEMIYSNEHLNYKERRIFLAAFDMDETMQSFAEVSNNKLLTGGELHKAREIIQNLTNKKSEDGYKWNTSVIGDLMALSNAIQGQSLMVQNMVLSLFNDTISLVDFNMLSGVCNIFGEEKILYLMRKAGVEKTMSPIAFIRQNYARDGAMNVIMESAPKDVRETFIKTVSKITPTKTKMSNMSETLFGSTETDTKVVELFAACMRGEKYKVAEKTKFEEADIPMFEASARLVGLRGMETARLIFNSGEIGKTYVERKYDKKVVDYFDLLSSAESIRKTGEVKKKDKDHALDVSEVKAIRTAAKITAITAGIAGIGITAFAVITGAVLSAFGIGAVCAAVAGVAYKAGKRFGETIIGFKSGEEVAYSTGWTHEKFSELDADAKVRVIVHESLPKWLAHGIANIGLLTLASNTITRFVGKMILGEEMFNALCIVCDRGDAINRVSTIAQKTESGLFLAEKKRAFNFIVTNYIDVLVSSIDQKEFDAANTNEVFEKINTLSALVDKSAIQGKTLHITVKHEAKDHKIDWNLTDNVITIDNGLVAASFSAPSVIARSLSEAKGTKRSLMSDIMQKMANVNVSSDVSYDAFNAALMKHAFENGYTLHSTRIVAGSENVRVELRTDIRENTLKITNLDSGFSEIVTKADTSLVKAYDLQGVITAVARVKKVGAKSYDNRDPEILKIIEQNVREDLWSQSKELAEKVPDNMVREIVEARFDGSKGIIRDNMDFVVNNERGEQIGVIHGNEYSGDQLIAVMVEKFGISNNMVSEMTKDFKGILPYEVGGTILRQEDGTFEYRQSIRAVLKISDTGEILSMGETDIVKRSDKVVFQYHTHPHITTDVREYLADILAFVEKAEFVGSELDVMAPMRIYERGEKEQTVGETKLLFARKSADGTIAPVLLRLNPESGKFENVAEFDAMFGNVDLGSMIRRAQTAVVPSVMPGVVSDGQLITLSLGGKEATVSLIPFGNNTAELTVNHILYEKKKAAALVPEQAVVRGDEIRTRVPAEKILIGDTLLLRQITVFYEQILGFISSFINELQTEKDGKALIISLEDKDVPETLKKLLSEITDVEIQLPVVDRAIWQILNRSEVPADYYGTSEEFFTIDKVVLVRTEAGKFEIRVPALAKQDFNTKILTLSDKFDIMDADIDTLIKVVVKAVMYEKQGFMLSPETKKIIAQAIDRVGQVHVIAGMDNAMLFLEPQRALVVVQDIMDAKRLLETGFQQIDKVTNLLERAAQAGGTVLRLLKDGNLLLAGSDIRVLPASFINKDTQGYKTFVKQMHMINNGAVRRREKARIKILVAGSKRDIRSIKVLLPVEYQKTVEFTSFGKVTEKINGMYSAMSRTTGEVRITGIVQNENSLLAKLLINSNMRVRIIVARTFNEAMLMTVSSIAIEKRGWFTPLAVERLRNAMEKVQKSSVNGNTTVTSIPGAASEEANSRIDEYLFGDLEAETAF